MTNFDYSQLPSLPSPPSDEELEAIKISITETIPDENRPVKNGGLITATDNSDYLALKGLRGSAITNNFEAVVAIRFAFVTRTRSDPTGIVSTTIECIAYGTGVRY
jgi:hypothetical protein